MIQKTIREISDAWREDKRPYVKQSTMAAYMLILENHILPKFGESNELHEHDVQGFVLEKLEGGLSVKSVKDILIVLKMVMKFGVKNEWMSYYEWDIKYPTDVAAKKLEVLSVANHKKILNYIQSHFSFPGLGIYISLSTQRIRKHSHSNPTEPCRTISIRRTTCATCRVAATNPSVTISTVSRPNIPTIATRS